MEIADAEVFRVEPRWTFVKLTSSDGAIGWGECVNVGGVVADVVPRLAERYLLGEDSLDIEDHWQRMYRGGFYRGGPVLMAAIAGLDQALWDLKGKEYGAPVHQLLGGKARDRVRTYTWIGGDRPSNVAEDARETVERGLTAMKMNATEEVQRVDSPAVIEAARERIAAVRETIGEEVDVALDFHGRVPKPMAKKLAAAVDPYDPFFIEEPVLAEQNEALPQIAAKTAAPIATGERMYSRYDFKELFADGVVDVVQPDLSHAGGITEVHKIASMADAHDVALAPHSPLGPIALAACLQVDANAPNAIIQENSLNIQYHDDVEMHDYLTDPSILEHEAGYLDVPDGPGLGIELDEDAFVPIDRDSSGGSDVWRHPDGSIAEW